MVITSGKRCLYTKKSIDLFKEKDVLYSCAFEGFTAPSFFAFLAVSYIWVIATNSYFAYLYGKKLKEVAYVWNPRFLTFFLSSFVCVCTLQLDRATPQATVPRTRSQSDVAESYTGTHGNSTPNGNSSSEITRVALEIREITTKTYMAAFSLFAFFSLRRETLT